MHAARALDRFRQAPPPPPVVDPAIALLDRHARLRASLPARALEIKNSMLGWAKRVEEFDHTTFDGLANLYETAAKDKMWWHYRALFSAAVCAARREGGEAFQIGCNYYVEAHGRRICVSYFDFSDLCGLEIVNYTGVGGFNA